MSDKIKALGVILARGGSKGIPRKNIRDICGHPLLSYSIYAGLHSTLLTHLVVSTDDEEIAVIAQEYGADIPFMRPAYLAENHIFSRDALYHAVLESEKHYGITFDYVAELVATNPFRDANDIDNTLEKLIETGADSVISLTRIYDHHPVRMKKIGAHDQISDFCREFPEGEGSRRQDLIPAYVRNGGIYAMKRSTIIDHYTRNGKDSRAYIMPAGKSVNIDETENLLLAETLISKGLCNNHPQKINPVIHVEHISNPGKPCVLFTAPIDFLPALKNHLAVHYDVIFAYKAPQKKVIELINDREIWVTSTAPPYFIDKKIIEKAGKLKVIASPSTGVTHMDMECIESQGIKVMTIDNSTIIDTIYASSEASFALLMALVKKLCLAAEKSKNGIHRENESQFRSTELHGKTLGIIGFGRIGKNMAKYAHTFGMKILAYDPFISIYTDYVIPVKSLKELLTGSDIVSLHIPYTKENTHFINEEKFRLMKDGAFFINTARGEVVDEMAMLKALENGKLKGAAVDVISEEQVSDKWDHPVIAYARNHSNLLFTPHIAGLTVESEEKATWDIIRQIDKFFNK